MLGILTLIHHLLFQGGVVLPKPASPEAMQSLDRWMNGEVAPEDLPQIDEEAAKVMLTLLLRFLLQPLALVSFSLFAPCFF